MSVDEDKIEPVEPTWPRVLKLQYPVVIGDETITSLTFRRGRAGDMKGIKLTAEVPIDDLHKIASRLCGQPTQVIEALDLDDAGEVIDIAADFYGKYLMTGRRR